MTLRIGISARLLHHPPAGSGLPRKPQQILGSEMAQWIMGCGVVALMIPFVDKRFIAERQRPLLDDLVHDLDGLVLQGGTDITPDFYGAKPWREGAETDPVRDEYELDLLRGFIRAGKPVLGICRGCQLINVYFGGTLVQDIPTQWPGAIRHVDHARYDGLTHEVHFVPGSRLSDVYGYAPQIVTSIHHQCVGALGRDIVIEARSPVDRVPEAIRHAGYPFVMGVQWHPEFQIPGEAVNAATLDSGPLMFAFLKAAARRAGQLRRFIDGMRRMRDEVRERRAPGAAR